MNGSVQSRFTASMKSSSGRSRNARYTSTISLRTSAPLDIGLDIIKHHVGVFAIGHRGADQGSDLGLFVGTAADRDLIEFLAVFLDAENTDLADVMMTGG